MVRVTYSDSAGTTKTTASQVDFDGRPVAYTDELGNTSTQSFDQASRVVATARGGGALTSLTYDADSRVSTTADAVGGGSFAFAYNADGSLTRISRPNGVTTNEGYDPSTGWLASITSTSTSGALPAAANASYTYSAARRITAQSVQGQASSFAYDAAGRLSAQGVNGVTTTSVYDADSNRCGVDTAACTGSFTYSAADRLTASPGVASYAYSYRGDVTAIGSAATIAYDANDHVTQTVDASGASRATATVVSDEVAPSGRVLQTSSAPQGSAATSDTFFGFSSGSDMPSYTQSGALSILGLTLAPAGPPTDYVTGPGGLLALDATGVGTVSATYPIADAHGDIVGTTDAAGTFTANPATDAWGVGSSAPANNLGWLGNDERYTTSAGLDLIQMGVRLYDPALGRFLEPDPVPGGSANAYDYCDQDPVNCLDLAGTFSFRHLFRVVDKISSGLTAVLAAVSPVCPVCGTLAVLTNILAVSAETASTVGDCFVHRNSSCASDFHALLFSALTFGAGKHLASFNESLQGSEAISKALDSETTAVAYSTKLLVQAATGKPKVP